MFLLQILQKRVKVYQSPFCGPGKNSCPSIPQGPTMSDHILTCLWFTSKHILPCPHLMSVPLQCKSPEDRGQCAPTHQQHPPMSSTRGQLAFMKWVGGKHVCIWSIVNTQSTLLNVTVYTSPSPLVRRRLEKRAERVPLALQGLPPSLSTHPPHTLSKWYDINNHCAFSSK